MRKRRQYAYQPPSTTQLAGLRCPRCGCGIIVTANARSGRITMAFCRWISCGWHGVVETEATPGDAHVAPTLTRASVAPDRLLEIAGQIRIMRDAGTAERPGYIGPPPGLLLEPGE